MPDNGAPDQLFTVPLGFSRLANHLPDGIRRHREVVRRPGQVSCQCVIGIFQVGQINVNFSIQLAQDLHPLIAAAVVHHRHRQLGTQSGRNGGQELGRGHEIDIFRPLGNQILKNPPQARAVRGHAHRPAADGRVLTVFAAQCAAAEEYRPAAAASRESGFFPFMKHGFCNQRGIRAAAEAPFPGSPVNPAPPGA